MRWLHHLRKVIGRERPRNNVAIPEKLDFLELIWSQEDDCETVTDKLLPTLGEKAPACLENLGTVLSLLDRMASCWWKCRGGDHLVEYLCGKVASNARGSLRLMRLGFYDESLILCRSIGETSNLLQLFALDKDSLEEWQSSSRRERMNSFGPKSVRVKLEDLGSPLIKEDRYRLLSEQAAHPHPQTKPQSYNMLEVPRAGASVQQEGLLISLNELALSLLPATIYGTRLLSLDCEIRDHILSASRKLAENIGGVTITEIGDYRRRALKDPAARDRFEQIAAAFRHVQDQRRKE